MYETTVANTNFIIQTQTLFLAIFGYIFLKEKISKLTLALYFFAISGFLLMVGSTIITRTDDRKSCCIFNANFFCSFDNDCKKFPK